MVSSLELTVRLLVLALWICTGSCAIPAMFLFGDSTVDTGNNNYLATRARANFAPYGVNFFSNATGRFCDGQLVPDFLASFLGLPYPLPYFKSGDLTQGVNFASAASGILRWPGNGLVMALAEQVDHFQRARGSMVNSIGFNATANLLQSSLFYVSTGNVDVMNLLHIWRTGLPSESRTQLLHELDQQIQRLYSFGARKIVVSGVSAIGCSPANQQAGHCNRLGIRASSYFNSGLSIALANLRHTFPDATFVMANMANLMLEAKTFPHIYGFKNTVRPCCPVNEPWRGCYTGALFCERTSDYMFWDLNNPSEAFNSIVAQRWWNGSSMAIAPVNIAQLAAL